MNKPAGIPWLRLLFASLNFPAVRQAIKTSINGLERQPELVRFVEQFQKVDQQDCVICLVHKYGREKKITLDATPPAHWCPARRNATLCGCGRKATRRGETGGKEYPVCEEFPGCLPAAKVRSRGAKR
jgi:hypothetical protein